MMIMVSAGSGKAPHTPSQRWTSLATCLPLAARTTTTRDHLSAVATAPCQTIHQRILAKTAWSWGIFLQARSLLELTVVSSPFTSERLFPTVAGRQNLTSHARQCCLPLILGW